MYEEVDTLSKKIELEQNVAYGPVKRNQTFELKDNVAYGPVKPNQWRIKHAEQDKMC